MVGDSIGDPFKGTAGPSMNILIKLMSLVSLALVPWLLSLPINRGAGDRQPLEPENMEAMLQAVLRMLAESGAYPQKQASHGVSGVFC